MRGAWVVETNEGEYIWLGRAKTGLQVIPKGGVAKKIAKKVKLVDKNVYSIIPWMGSFRTDFCARKWEKYLSS
jgi:hypothetical protein